MILTIHSKYSESTYIVLQQFSADNEEFEHSFTFPSIHCVQIRESRRSDEIMPPGSVGGKTMNFA